MRLAPEIIVSPEIEISKGIKVSHTCDARACCPGNVMEAKRGFHYVKIGEILEIIASDSDEDVKYYLPMWVDKMGHELIGIQDFKGYFKIWIRKMK